MGAAAVAAEEDEDGEDAAASWCDAPLGWAQMMCGEEEEEDPAAGS